MPPAACGLSYLFQARLVVAQRIDAALRKFLSGHCATESRKAAPGPRAWPAESPGGHVGQPDVSSAVVASAQGTCGRFLLAAGPDQRRHDNQEVQQSDNSSRRWSHTCRQYRMLYGDLAICPA